MVEIRTACGSEYGWDFHRPITAEAVRRLDPQLDLVFNRRYGMFQVIRWTLIASHLHVDDLGGLLVLHRVPFWECDVEPRHLVEQEDCPHLLIADMDAGDTLKHPELLNDNENLETVVNYRAKMEAKVREEWRHATAFNRRQVFRIWEPFRSYSGYVR